MNWKMKRFDVKAKPLSILFGVIECISLCTFLFALILCCILLAPVR